MGSHTIASTAGRVDDSVQSAADDLRRVVQALRVCDTSAEREVGLSGAQLFVLQQLAAEGAPSVAALAERTFTHQSSVSVVVRRLVARGFVVKTTDDGDSRKVSLAITPAGRRALVRAPDSAAARIVSAIQALAAQDRDALTRGLSALVCAMGIPSSPPPLFLEDELSTFDDKSEPCSSNSTTKKRRS